MGSVEFDARDKLIGCYAPATVNSEPVWQDFVPGVENVANKSRTVSNYNLDTKNMVQINSDRSRGARLAAYWKIQIEQGAPRELRQVRGLVESGAALA